MNIKEIKIDNKKLLLATMGVVGLVSAAVGLTFAYLSINISGNDNASSINVTTANLKIEFLDGEYFTMSDLMPGQSISKTFSVINRASKTIYYDIIMTDIETTITGSDFVYTLSSTNGGGAKSETLIPATTGALVEAATIPVSTTQTYTLTMTYKNRNYNQIENMGATYRARLTMEAYEEIQ